MESMNTHEILAYYLFTKIEDPHAEVKKHHKFLESLDVRCRVYIAQNGINAQMSFIKEDAKKYLDWLRSDSRFAGINLKVDPCHEHVLPKVTVKFRKELASLGREVDPKKGGEVVSPENWKQMLENRDENTILIDVRNDYESRVGHFEGAECPPLKVFRDFPRYADQLGRELNPKKTKVMMYCTGGIRCELYSVLLKEKGFEEVYQLEGGIINYGKKVGDDHWKGSLFVFDDRLTVPICNKKNEKISNCDHCKTPSDVFYNCANMDCNALFLACPSCAEKLQGCCSEECMGANRCRAYEKTDRPKPFRKWYHYAKSKQ